MKLVDEQKLLMRQALKKLQEIDMVYSLFNNVTKSYADERAAQLKIEYAAIVTKLVQITTQAVMERKTFF